MDGIKIDREGALKIAFTEVEVKINGIAIAAVDVDARADVGEFVVGILGTDVVPPGLGAEYRCTQIIGATDFGAVDGVQDQTKDAVVAVISNRSTDGWLSGYEIEA